jgi:hypothetical protein
MQLQLDLSKEINQLHDKLFGIAKTSLETAIHIGELLTRQKAELGHGNWLPWCELYLRFSDRTASKYISLYNDRDRIKSELGSDLGVNEAYRLLSQPAEEQPQEPEPELSLPEPQADGDPEAEPEQSEEPISQPEVGVLPPEETNFSGDVAPEEPAPCEGMVWAEKAIRCLEKIHRDDQQRKKAMRFVQKWIDLHSYNL